MTIEEAIFILANIDRRVCDDELSEALDMAIQALNQEPCDDCISRQAVLEYIEGNEADLWHKSENELVCQDIKELLPVIPTRKTGRWIKGNSYGDQYNYYQSYVCSCCKCECGDVHGWKYCPNCGAKMESEG